MLATLDEGFGGQWSVEKLECVEAYICSYLKVMQNQRWKLSYIDAFSGEGVQRFKHSIQPRNHGSVDTVNEAYAKAFTEGSSLRALAASKKREIEGGRGFDHFCFIELNKAKLDALRCRILSQFPDCENRCVFICGDANKELPELIRRMDWQKDRAVSFIDPFATQFKWSSFECFRNTCCDVWMLFPLFAIIRMLPTSHMPSEDWCKSLDEIFGEGDWRNLYHKTTQLSLFGEEAVEREKGIDQLLEYATRRYRQAFPGVWGPAVLRTERNAPLFALYALTANHSPQALSVSGKISRHLLNGIGAREI